MRRLLRRQWHALGSALLVGVIAAACSSGGGAGRAIAIVADDAACTPATVTAQPGERLTLEITNRASGDREIEGIEGTRLEEVLIPVGRMRKVNFTMPQTGSARLKCYIPGGPTSIIELAPARG